MQAATHMFFQQMSYEFSLQPRTSPEVQIKAAWHSFWQDATNGRDKYSTMILDSAFVCFDGLGEKPQTSESSTSKISWTQLATRITRTSDVLPIKDESGRGAFAFSDKAFRSLGCPTLPALLVEHQQSDDVSQMQLNYVCICFCFVWVAG